MIALAVCIGSTGDAVKGGGGGHLPPYARGDVNHPTLTKYENKKGKREEGKTGTRA
jgi:hypothetical protein